MTDTTETPATDFRARNKEIVFAALTAAGIHRVIVEYDGSDDSGQIEYVEAWTSANQTMPFPTEPRIELVAENPDSPREEYNLEAAVETVVWSYLYDLHEGWENNDGAFGNFVFDVATRTIRIEHAQRFTDVSISQQVF
jgi:hypothetical protein